MSDKLKIDFLRGIALRGPGVRATQAFYEKQWGLASVAQDEAAMYFRGSMAEHWIWAMREDPVFGIDYLHFGMHTRERVDALHRDVEARGLAVSAAPGPLATPGGGYGFELIDPEARRLRISAEVAGHADREDDKGKPRKISHVVLNTPDLAGMEQFYTEVLGFTASDYSADAMVFLSCHSDHHSIAFNRSPFVALNHVAFAMPSIDGFMRGIGRMRTGGQPPAWGPGRHGPGDNTFCYFVSPSGFVIEYTSEVQQIDHRTHRAQVWPRDKPDAADQWMTAGPPSALVRVAMQGRPDPGFDRVSL